LNRSPDQPPPRENLARNLAMTFALTVVVYLGGFYWVEHRRNVKGPWEIVFAADASGQPSLRITQATLGISEKLVFPGGQVGRTNFSQPVKFGEMTTNLPFGEFVFQDPLYLPGDITLRLCGHQIEAIPRTLIIDKTERPWQPGAEITLPSR